MAVKYPQCGSAEFFYAQEVTEYYTIAEISDEDNSYVDLKDLTEEWNCMCGALPREEIKDE